MSLSKEKAIGTIEKLISRFDDQKESYLKGSYNETLTRQDFINPFFKALGWDVDNECGYAESYREVIHEDKIKISGATKAPDYSFRLAGGKRLFFVEAKKPSILIKDDIIPAYQVRRYGWSAKLPISIITDFQEFAVYDCTKKPNPADKAGIARIKYLTYSEYIDNFDFIWNTFSKERVLQGSFDKFIQNDTYKKGTATVDSEFLMSLDKWRTSLAITISKNNKNLNEDEINFAVQQTIDRLIFLRIAEDRNIEPYENLKSCLKHENRYQSLHSLFESANEKYNSGLFDFNKDKICGSLEIENSVIKTIINELYYPECPYAFAVLPVEILGTAYEQFLGKQIKIDAKHKVTIEPKPDVRKAGGVYYTPHFIVEYIVRKTIGELIANKSPKEISKIKIIDPACGSGSFLLGAYEYLLNYHKNYYNQEKIAKGGKTNFLTPEGNLTTGEKKRILINNIYGVDIDTNATEVTKLSLLLKCMEGETQASIESQLRLFHDRILPTLDNNIKTGNSLVDTDYYDDAPDFEKVDTKAFNWGKAFPEVFSQKGFDVVIGNPPYLNTKRGFAEDPYLNAYLKKKYLTATGQFDAYSLFIEKAINLLHKEGYWGMIIPKPILTNETMIEIRKYVLKSGNITNIADFGTPFKDANVESVVICQSKRKSKNNSINISIYDGNLYKDTVIEQNLYDTTPHHSFILKSNKSINKILEKIESQKIPFKELTSKLIRGIEAGKSDGAIRQVEKNKKCKPLLRGQDVSRYSISGPNTYIEVDFDDVKKFKDKSLYEVEKKLLIRRVGSNLQATIDKNHYWNLNTIYNVHLKDNNYEAVLGVFNSRLISFWFKNRYVFEDKLFPYVRVSQLEQIPFHIDINSEANNHIKSHVQELLKLNDELAKVKIHSKHEDIKTKIEYHEDKINALVYKMYGLTQEDIILIEQNL